MRFPIPGDNPNSLVITSGKPQILGDVTKIYSAFQEEPNNHIHSWLGVPLLVHKKIIGLLAIDSSEVNDFTNEDLNLAVEFADQVAIALDNALLFKETQNQAITDSLTGIYNRRGLFQVGEFEITRARRIGRPFSVLILDIDHFKRINDHYGHTVGDQALRILADLCRTGSRNVDLVGRYGGEEFVLLLTETPLDSAGMVAERLRQSIKDSLFQTDAGPLRITVSIGVAEAADAETLKELIQRADVALYEAKNNGRNCVVVSRKIGDQIHT
jgi:diguanylate cyclase (GGDEF)-like protein